MADSGKESEERPVQLGSMGSCSLFACNGGLQMDGFADSRSSSVAPSLSSSPPLSSYPSGSLDSALSLSGRLPSLELPSPPASGNHKACAKQLNMRLMHSNSAQDIFDLALAHMDCMDSINLTAAFQRLARYSEGAATKESVLDAPIFRTMAEMLIDECNAGRFNSQSTSNAWWAISKLVPSTHALSAGLLMALETALLGCLSSPTEGERPNSQAVSSIFYAWGRLDGYLPSTRVLNLMWDRALHLALTFDTQGVANVVWALGILKKKHGDAFAIRTDVLSALSFLVQRIIPSFAVQGLSCAAIGCANMGPSLRCSVTPLMESIIAESLRRPTQFTLQAMANLVCAIAHVGHTLIRLPQTQMLLAAFDAHAATLPPPHKPQEAYTLHASMTKCGHPPRCFHLMGPSMDSQGRCIRQGAMGLPPPTQQQMPPQLGQGYAQPPLAAAAQMEAAALQAAALAAATANSQQASSMLPSNSLLLNHHNHQALNQVASAAATACMAGSYAGYATPFAAVQPNADGYQLPGYVGGHGMGLAYLPQPMKPPPPPPQQQQPLGPRYGAGNQSYAQVSHMPISSLAGPICCPRPTAAEPAGQGRPVDLQAILLALQAFKLQQDQMANSPA